MLLFASVRPLSYTILLVLEVQQQQGTEQTGVSPAACPDRQGRVLKGGGVLPCHGLQRKASETLEKKRAEILMAKRAHYEALARKAERLSRCEDTPALTGTVVASSHWLLLQHGI